MTEVILAIQCKYCGSIFEIKVTRRQWKEYLQGSRHIQDIFFYKSPAERELLISNVCEDCWDAII